MRLTEKQLHELLFTHTENESYYLNNPGTLSVRYSEEYTPRQFINGKEVMIIDVPQLNDSPLFVRKDSRYTFLPFHCYNDINMNYIYSGTCTYFIEGKEITLKAGDVCIFDKRVIRAKMRPDYGDIIININMKNDYFNSLLSFNQTNVLLDFMNRTLINNDSHDNYIIFKTRNNDQITNLFNKLLIEYYSNQIYSLIAIQHYFSLILLELLYLDFESSEIHFSDKLDTRIFQIINHIEKNYKTITLRDLANLFNYHEKYLSTLLSKNYGKSFKEIQFDCKLKEVEKYLIHSDLPISEIALLSGFSNQNQLYKKFKEKYGTLPKKYRIQYKLHQ
ncbi:AraC family transcriptional regulator [Streptococcus hillyeri]|uniref:AraC family transcriptional regulator n=1 Tax=Streptococcus hillyeri TaxID=2282420 RepID=A0A3L9DX55_9STRE|nr:AraC family transcriptional regulator [Streptococcus hillyeri]RLY04858.1 AraC family transcriptional regulator [Streptococcus hillyeri]